MGYDKRRLTVIHNGFDTRLFKPDESAARSLREELGLPREALLVGHVGRYAPQKDYPTLVRAAARVLSTRPDVHFLLCGNRIDIGNGTLAALVRAAGHEDRLHLLGVRSDITRVTAALDILVLSSSTEAFPSSVGEAMASGVPVVSTAVGDVPKMVGDTGTLVPRGDPVALADGLLGMIARPPEERRRLGALARRRIEENFSLDQMVEAYMRCYRKLAAAKSAAPQPGTRPRKRPVAGDADRDTI
jgi:glycosyltransferase involved in cell wall biosynthesis